MAIAAVLAVVSIVYWKTTLSMVAIWARSATFAHGFVVIPVFLFLLLRQKDELGAIEPKPYWPALLGIAAAGAAWLAGTLVSAAVVTQFAIVAIVPLAVWAIFGTRTVRALAIPLAFLFFAVPFGEFLMPTLMDWTADFTVAAIRASGVPIYRDGNFFTIPSGSWSIVEACSGLRYLIASLMVGCLYAYLAYRSPRRRVAFITASVIVSIFANWLRAYMIVMIGHLSDNRIAVGVDHLIYGWVFFGVVITLLLWVGSRWREDEASHPSVPHDEIPSAHRGGRVVPAALAALVTASVWQPMAAGIDRHAASGAIRLGPVMQEGAWAATSDTPSTWRPGVLGARAEIQETFVEDGKPVVLYIAFFRDQTADSKAITSSNELVHTDNKAWRQTRAGYLTLDIGGSPMSVRTAVVTNGEQRLAVWQWYWVDGHMTANDYAGKLYQLLSLIRGHGDPVAWVVIYTPTTGDGKQAEPVLKTFASEMKGSIEKAVTEAAR